jgi:hypothetical protein
MSNQRFSVGRVTDEAHFTADLGADWLDRVELMMAVEDQFAGFLRKWQNFPLRRAAPPSGLAQCFVRLFNLDRKYRRRHRVPGLAQAKSRNV